MQKKSKTILTAVVTALFVLSIGYFALLAPTTAWFYQKEDKAYSFTFGNFNMSEKLQQDEVSLGTFTLRGATRFADAGETLFDEMLHVVKVQATNAGEMAGSVRVRVKQGNSELFVDNIAVSESGSVERNTLKIVNNFNRTISLSLTLTASTACLVSDNGTDTSLQVGENTLTFSVASGNNYAVSDLPDDIDFKLEYALTDVESGTILEDSVPRDGKSIEFHRSGLKWFVYAPSASTTAKSAMDTMLHAWNSEWPINYNTLTGGTADGTPVTYTDYNPVDGEAETAYEAYNVKATEALKEFNKGGVSVLPSETNKEIYVVFWAEYGDLKTDLGVGDSASTRDTSIPTLTFSNLSIDIIAAPDIGGTQTTTLTLSNTTGSSASVKLYRWNLDEWTAYVNTDGGLTDSDGVITVSESTQIPNLSVGMRYKVELQGTAYFDSSDTSKDVNSTGKVITGTLSNDTNTVTIQSSPSLVVSNSATSAVSVKLYTWASGAWTEASGSPLSVAAGASSQVSLAVNTQYKLELTSASVHFNNSGNATQIMGTITGGANTVSVVPD